MTTKERLKQYIDNDEVYQDYKNGNINLTDFEKFCIQHCKDIEEILEENQIHKAAIDKAINYIEGHSKFILGKAERRVFDGKLECVDEVKVFTGSPTELLDILKEVE